MPRLGSEIWFMYFNPETNRFFPKYAGKVEGVRGDEVLVAGRWRALEYPYWTDEETALRDCEAKGPVMPAIK